MDKETRVGHMAISRLMEILKEDIIVNKDKMPTFDYLRKIDLYKTYERYNNQ